MGAGVVGTPGEAADLHAMDGRHYRPLTAGEFERVTAHDAAGAVRLIELLAPDAIPRAAIAIEHFFEIAGDPRIGMEHEVLANQAAGVGKAAGEPRGRGIQQNARRADGVAGENDDFSRLEMLDPIRIVVDHARRHAVFVGSNLAHSAARAQLDTGADRGGPGRDVGARLGTLRATGGAMAEVDARRPALVLHCSDLAVGGPPVPAELVEPTRQRRPRLAQRPPL